MAFDVIKDVAQLPNGYKFIRSHLIVDIKMEDFCCKAKLVTKGHMTDVLAMVTNPSIVS